MIHHSAGREAGNSTHSMLGDSPGVGDRNSGRGASACRPRTARRFVAALFLSLALLAGVSATPLVARVAPAAPSLYQPSPLPALPAGWPGTLELGTSSAPGEAASMREVAPYGFRYQYLAGGVNTGSGWATWNSDGQFVTYYIQDSVANGIVPVFTYYQIYQSAPGKTLNETDGVHANLQNPETMAAYLADLKLFFQRAGAFPDTMLVLHVEPDMWGYIQRRASGDDASSVPATVAATGLPELADLPDTAAGLAQAIVRLRDNFAPNVLLGYHVSIWGTGHDIQYGNPSDAAVPALAERAGAFYLSLQTNFDLAFSEFSDRDAGFKEIVTGDRGASWWDADSFQRHARFLGKFVEVAQKRVVLWQIPLGNRRMRAMNNTWGHYQDNRVEWLLDDPSREHLEAYEQAGVVAFLFGGGAAGTTCACDARKDGVTDPEPINGNTGLSQSADDDGGFFKQKVQEYYAAGRLTLPSEPSPAPVSDSGVESGIGSDSVAAEDSPADQPQ